MAPVVILLFVFLTLDQLTSLLAADEYSERTTLDEYFPKYDKQYFYSRVRTPVNSSDEIYFENTPLWHLRYEVYNYSKTVQLKVKSEFLSELSKVTLLSVSQDLKRHCGEDLKNTIEDFHVTPRLAEFYRAYAFNLEFWRFLLDRLPDNKSLEKLQNKVLNYSETFQLTLKSEFLYELSKVTVMSVSQDLNHHCGEDLKEPIEDLSVTGKNVTCVRSKLFEILRPKLKTASAVAVKKLTSECGTQQQQHLVAPVCNCTVDFYRHLGKQLNAYIEYKNALDVTQNTNDTPIQIVLDLLSEYINNMDVPMTLIILYFDELARAVSLLPSIEPFRYEDFIHPGIIQPLIAYWTLPKSFTETQDGLTWGIIKSSLGSVEHPCDLYKEEHPVVGSEGYQGFVSSCYTFDMMNSHLKLAHCVNEDRKPLTWSAGSSVYVHSQCLCVAYNRTDCGVLEEPRGHHCLSVLLQDFRRQIWYRPAVTYMDYAFMAKVPVCQFARIVSVGYSSECSDYYITREIFLIQLVRCYFDGLVDRNLNCSQRLEMRDLNPTLLCGLRLFVMLVACDDEDFNSSVPFYEAGDSTLVEILYYVDVSVRVLTLVTYLSCPQLRNLPGKLLISYQTTALLRLLVVPRLKDLALAVRLDVTSDLSSTLWLTSYLHFLTSSIKTLRLPDSLSPDEVRAVLLRYSLLGWAAPAALSSLCFWMDDAVDSRVQFGQLLLVLCTYAALVWNIFMLYENINFYHDVKSNAASIKKNVKVRSVFADLFEFAVKTSVLSGAGITFRLIFTQIQGLEHVLGYYHAMGTLQGLLLFVLYGCNREARAFWRRTFSAIALSLLAIRRENNPT